MTSEEIRARRREYQRRYRAKNPQPTIDANRRWRERNRQRIAEYHRAWYVRNAGARLSQIKESLESRPEYRAKWLEWRKAHPEKVQEYGQRARAKRLAATRILCTLGASPSCARRASASTPEQPE